MIDYLFGKNRYAILLNNYYIVKKKITNRGNPLIKEPTTHFGRWLACKFVLGWLVPLY